MGMAGSHRLPDKQLRAWFDSTAQDQLMLPGRPVVLTPSYKRVKAEFNSQGEYQV